MGNYSNQGSLGNYYSNNTHSTSQKEGDDLMVVGQQIKIAMSDK